MSKFVIDPKSISPEGILIDIQDYLASKPDSEGWKDFYVGSAGTTVTELIAGMGGFLSYQAIIARREAFLRYAQNRSSLIGHAQNRGYSVYRGQNPRVQITATPTVTLALKKFDVVGSVKDFDLVLLEDVNFVSGTQVTFSCTVGLSKTESITYAGNSGPMALRFKQPAVSEDIQIKLNGDIVSYSKRLVDAASGKWVAQSNSVGSIDLFYLNDPTYTVVSTSDTISLQYVEYTSRDFLASDVSLDYDGLQTTVITSALIPPESNLSITINAPIYAETQYIVRAREDYTKILRLLNPSVIDVGHKDVSPMVVAMYYIKNDLTLLSPDEKQDLIDAMITHRNMGLVPPIFDEPTRIPITINCSVKYTELVSGINLVIQAICLSYQNTLGKKLDFEAIERDIEDLTGVKIARVTIGTTAHQTDKYVQNGQVVHSSVDSNIVYRVREFKYLSDSTEPIWPTTVGDTVTDGKLVWECKYFEGQCDPEMPSLPLIPGRPSWVADNQYRIGQIVVPTVLGIHEYKVVDIVNKTGSTEPVWTTLSGATPTAKKGSLVYDGEILWQATPVVGTPLDWSADTQYHKGDSVVATDPEASDSEGLMFQAVGYMAKTGSVAPTFPVLLNSFFDDGDIVWETVDKTVSPLKLAKNEFYVVTPVVALISGAGE